MPPSPPSNRKISSLPQSRNSLVERCSSIRACEPCKRRKRICNGQRPCSHCTESNIDCIYSVVSEHPRSVFTTSSARRLSSGSACETCRRRKTKCDGGSPCGFCSSNGIDCVNNSERRRRSMGPPAVTNPNETEAMDRIEDRLRRIEKLMTAFTPSPLSQSSSTTQYKEEIPQMHPIRQHRHSVQGISVAKEQAELRAAYANMKGSLIFSASQNIDMGQMILKLYQFFLGTRRTIPYYNRAKTNNSNRYDADLYINEICLATQQRR
jgi:hypothetical protein